MNTMFGLSRFLQPTGKSIWRVNRRGSRRWPHVRRQPARRAIPGVEVLEDRVVPTLLGQQLFPADYPWNQDITSAPVAANSAAVMAHIGTSINLHPDWGEDNASNGASPLYGIPFNVVHGNTTAKINVIIDNYPGESDITAVPIPANAVIEGDFQNGPNPNGGGYNANQRGDSHLLVWDEDNNVAYELYGVTRPSDPKLFPDNNGVELAHTDGKWHAAQESVWDMKANSFRTLGDTSADAAGLSILAGLARPDEGLPTVAGGQGAITHALRFTLPSGDINPQYIYPASHIVNVSSGSTKLPFGARLRLMDTPAVNSLINGMGPQAQIIAHAMQHYGLVLADIGSAMYVTGASASQDASNKIALTWDMNDVLGLRSLTSGDFQVVDLTPVVTSVSPSSALANSTVTINGQNFSGAAGHLSVFFGGTASSSVTFVSDTQITAVVPSGSGTVDVTVQSGVNENDNVSSNPNANVNAPIFGYGTSAITAADQFTYSTKPISGSNSTASFASSSVVSGNTDLLTIVVQDTSGGAVSGLGNGAFTLGLSGGTSAGTFGKVTESATPGTYTTTFTGTTAGTTSTLTVTINGVTLASQPTITVTPGPVSGTKSTVGFASSTVASGNTDVVTLLVEDGAGNAISGLANGAFALGLSGGTSSGSFSAVSETTTAGTYTATFTGATAGTVATLTATVNGVTLAGHPTLTVTSTTSFTDDFAASGPNQQLASPWSTKVGKFQVQTTAATATGIGPVDLATVPGIHNADEVVSATVTVTAGKMAGLVARYAGPGDQNMDFGAVVGGSGTYTAYLFRNLHGVWAALFAHTYVGSVTNAALEFDVVGSSLRLFLNGGIIAYANDTALTAAGSVGMRTTAGAVLKSFNAGPLTLQNSASSTTFSDNFATAGNNQQLTNFWFNQAGNFQDQTAAATATGIGPVNVATVNGIHNADEAVSATVTVTAGKMAGLVARYAGPGDQNMDFGAVVGGSGAYTAYLFRNFHGGWATLFARTYSGSVTNAVLEFDVVGSSLRLFRDGGIVAYANDTVLTAAGSVGMRTTAGAVLANFSAGPLTLANQSLPFSDNFNTPGANGQLSTSWFNRVGNIQVTSAGVARGVGAPNVATVNGISVANVTVQADITLSAIGQAAGLVTRYSGTGDRNMYYAAVAQTGAGMFQALLYVNVNGVWTLLRSHAVASGIGTLKLAVNGTSLTLSYGGSTLFTVINSSLSAAGAVGLRLSAGATADNFSAS
jgi:hypothetical protein